MFSRGTVAVSAVIVIVDVGEFSTQLTFVFVFRFLFVFLFLFSSSLACSLSVPLFSLSFVLGVPVCSTDAGILTAASSPLFTNGSCSGSYNTSRFKLDSSRDISPVVKVFQTIRQRRHLLDNFEGSPPGFITCLLPSGGKKAST